MLPRRRRGDQDTTRKLDCCQTDFEGDCGHTRACKSAACAMGGECTVCMCESVYGFRYPADVDTAAEYAAEEAWM